MQHFNKLISSILGEKLYSMFFEFLIEFSYFLVITFVCFASSSRVLELGDRFLDVRSEGELKMIFGVNLDLKLGMKWSWVWSEVHCRTLVVYLQNLT